MFRLTRWTLTGVALAPGVACAQRLGGGGEPSISFVRILSALVLCLMIAALAALLLKRSGGKVDISAVRGLFARLPVKRRIEVVESRRVSQHADLALVRCDGQEFLILSSAEQQQVLRTVDLPETPGAGVSE